MDWSHIAEVSFNWLLGWLVGPDGAALGRVRPPQRVTVITVGPGPAPIVVGPGETADVDVVAETWPKGGLRDAPDRSSSASHAIVGPATLLIIEPPRRPAWDERGWHERIDGGLTVYEGLYQITRRDGTCMQFQGRIVLRRDEVTPYIANPPAAIKRHPKGPCFQLTQAPWFRVHWHKPARTVDDALLYVERILSEVLRD